MKSPITGKEMKLVFESMDLNYRKETFKVYYHSYVCKDSGEHYTTDELDEINQMQVYNQYREKYGIPFPEEIKQIRNKYGISASKMSEILGFGIHSYRKYEAGEIPSVANGRLILTIKHPRNFIEQVEACSSFLSLNEKDKLIRKAKDLKRQEKEKTFRNLLYSSIYGAPEATEFTGYRMPCKKKIAAIIGFFSEATNLYKTKLNKLFFYADFGHYQKHGKSITGLKYRAIDYGPVPNGYDEIYVNLVSEGMIQKQYKESTEGFYGEKFFGSGELSNDLFEEEEIETLHKVIKIFKDKSSSQMVDLSHDEKAWIENEPGIGIISYQKYAFGLVHFKNNDD